MNQYTKEEIVAKVEEIWSSVQDEHGYEYAAPDSVEVTLVEDGSVEIELSSMYEAPSLSFYQLTKVSQYFDTDNINDSDTFSEDGCETCDYGSKYGFTLTIRPRVGG